MIASWPGPDPAIHVYRRPRGVDHRVKPGDDDVRVKPGDDDLRVSGEKRLAVRSLAPSGETESSRIPSPGIGSRPMP